MHKQFYFLSPVEVVKVTSSNLEEVAEWCGGSVQETESRRNPGKMDKYVWVPTPKGNRISWAFPGMFITKRLVLTMKDELKETWAVYRRDYFEKNYFDSPSDATDATWERQAIENSSPKKIAEPVEVVVHMGEVMAEAMERVAKAGKKEAEPVEVEVVVNGVTLDKPAIKKKVAVKRAGTKKVEKVDPSEIEDVELLDEVAISG